LISDPPSADSNLERVDTAPPTAQAERREPFMADIQATQRELAAAYFESTAPRWDEFYADHGKQTVYATIYRSRLATALSLADGLRLPPGSHCLDIGCGPGIATVALAQRGFAVDAVDLVEAQLDRVRRRVAEARLGKRVVTTVGDIHHLDFPDGVFDFVLVIGVMEWLEDPDKPLREISRVLKPGGRAILSVDNKWALRNIFDPLMTPPLAPFKRHVGRFLSWCGLRRQSGPHDYSYSIAEFDRLTANAGLEKAEGVTVGFGPFSFLRWELPQSLGLALHSRLQRLADQKFPVLRSAGFVYVTVVEKGGANGENSLAHR
jgi:ubiquinone/menaquinone biosynthesis C-methylase UbiE